MHFSGNAPLATGVAFLSFWVSAANSVPASEALFQRGVSALSARDYPTALELLEAVLKSDPDNIRYGSEYRRAIIEQAKALHPAEGRPEDYDRALNLFARLVEQSPKAANAHLNYGFAYVDKIPAAGAITQVILANNALTQFTEALELKPSWIGLYTRGKSYLFWPRIFNKTQLGIDDLEQAMKLQKAGPKKSYHVRVYVALGDAMFKVDNLDRARAFWGAGLKEFPGSPDLKERLSRQGDQLKALVESALDYTRRVDTDLRELWTN